MNGPCQRRRRPSLGLARLVLNFTPSERTLQLPLVYPAPTRPFESEIGGSSRALGDHDPAAGSAEHDAVVGVLTKNGQSEQPVVEVARRIQNSSREGWKRRVVTEHLIASSFCECARRTDTTTIGQSHIGLSFRTDRTMSDADGHAAMSRMAWELIVQARDFYVSRFRREWVGRDLVAGLVLASLLIPQGMAYASLAGLPPITGLYTSMACLIAYAAVGLSRVLVLGPNSALGGMIAATVLPLTAAAGDPNKAVIYASVMALMVGSLMVIGAFARLGFIADLLSRPEQIGYMNGVALATLVGQLPKLFGFSTAASGLINECVAFVNGVTSGATVPAAIAIGAISLVIMLVLRQLLPRIPGVLVAVSGHGHSVRFRPCDPRRPLTFET